MINASPVLITPSSRVLHDELEFLLRQRDLLGLLVTQEGQKELGHGIERKINGRENL